MTYATKDVVPWMLYHVGTKPSTDNVNPFVCDNQFHIIVILYHCHDDHENHNE